MKPIPDYGEHMSLAKFIHQVCMRAFIDDDGTGYYATKAKVSLKLARPSDIIRGRIDRRFSHVMWFNK